MTSLLLSVDSSMADPRHIDQGHTSSPSLERSQEIGQHIQWSLFAVGDLGLTLSHDRDLEVERRLDWKPREGHSVTPSRLDVGGRVYWGGRDERMRHTQASPYRWSVYLSSRLFRAPMFLETPLSYTREDPAGLFVLPHTLSLRYSLSASLPIHLQVGRFIPHIERSPLVTLRSSFDQHHLLWSHAPDPRDRAVIGASSFIAIPRLDAQVALELFTPSDERSPTAQLGRRGWGATLSSRWTLSRGAVGLTLLYADKLAVTRGAQEQIETYSIDAIPGSIDAISGGVERNDDRLIKREHAVKWANLIYQIKLMRGLNPISYHGELSLFEGSLSGLSEAQEASISQQGLIGRGISTAQGIEWTVWSTLRIIALYQWTDPHLDFAFDTRHELSSTALIAFPSPLRWRLKYTHRWTSQADRLSIISDEISLWVDYQFFVGIDPF